MLNIHARTNTVIQWLADFSEKKSGWSGFCQNLNDMCTLNYATNLFSRSSYE